LPPNIIFPQSSSSPQLTRTTQQRTLALDPTPILQFAAFSLLSTPLNCAWQEWLEARFPSKPGATRAPPAPTSKDEKPAPDSTTPSPSSSIGGVDPRNTAIKFALDQTLGAAFNTILFVVGISLIKGKGWDASVKAVGEDGMDIYWAGVKLWPAVSLLSFTLIPVKRRVLFGCLVGVVWGIILSLKVAK
jgi:protein Mpv17